MNESTVPQHPVFELEKLYVKDLSLEIPHAPAVFLERESPKIDIELASQAQQIGEERYEVTVTVTVGAKLKDKTMFLIEAKQAGIFRILNIPHEQMEQVLAVVCPNMLYPYLRETVTDTSVRAGFAPMLLSPLNFEALYQQKKQQEQVPETTH